MGEALIEFVQAHPGYMKALTLYDAKIDSNVLRNHPRREEYEKLVQELIMIWTRAVQIGMQDGSISAETNPKVLAIQLGCSIRGILQFYHLSSDGHVVKGMLESSNETIESIISQFIGVLLNGIQKSNKS